MRYRPSRALPYYQDPDAEDAYHLTVAASSLFAAGEASLSEAVAAKAAAIMARFPSDPKRSGDKEAGRVTYSHLGVLTASSPDGAVYFVPAPPFDAVRDEKREGSRSAAAVRKTIDYACRIMRFGWFASLQLRSAATDSKLKTPTAPAATLGKLLPVCAAYDPGMPEEALEILGGKAAAILAKNPVGAHGSSVWTAMTTAPGRNRPVAKLALAEPPARPPARRRRTEACLAWFGKDAAVQAVRTILASRNDIYGCREALAAIPLRAVSWPATWRTYEYDVLEPVRPALRAAFPNAKRYGAAERIVQDGIGAAVQAANVLRFHQALLLSGDEDLAELAVSARMLDPDMEIPDGFCRTAGLTAALARMPELRRDHGATKEDAALAFSLLAKRLGELEGDGSLSWRLAAPGDAGKEIE